MTDEEKSLKDFEIVGQRIPNIDAPPKSLGQTQYVDDIRLPNMLPCSILGSPFPHAKVRHVDVSRARALTGVKAVLTGQDIPDVIFGEFIGGELGKGDHYALALDKVR